MQYKEIISSAINSLRGNIMRTSLTMLGIIIGISAVILIYSIGQGAVKFINDELSSFGTDYFSINPGSSQVSTFAGSTSLTFEDLDAIKNDESLTNIKYVAPIAVASVRVEANEESDEIAVYGITSEGFQLLRPDVQEGDTEMAEGDRVVVMGSDAVETFFGKNASVVGETLRIKNRPYRIVGVVHSNSVLGGSFLNTTVYVPIDEVTNYLLGEERLTEIDIAVHNPDTINQTIEDVEFLLRERHNLKADDENDFRIQSAQDALATIDTVTTLLTTMIVAISGISLVVGGVGVMNIMLVSVTERTKEIGLLKAIGAKEKDILTQFLIEAMVMCLIGGVVGIIIGIAGAFGVAKAFNIPFVVSVPAILIAVGVSMLVGVVFGLYPARRAAKLSPIDALRYE